jgi:hypothetical protein
VAHAGRRDSSFVREPALKQMQRHHEQYDANSEVGDPGSVPKIHGSAPAESDRAAVKGEPSDVSKKTIIHAQLTDVGGVFNAVCADDR